jgi:hypothetical protein
VDKALKKERAARYVDAAEMHDALMAAAAQVPKELDRTAPMFPPKNIRDRVQSRRPRGDEAAGQDEESPDDPSAPRLGMPTQDTLHERSRPRHQQAVREADSDFQRNSVAPRSRTEPISEPSEETQKIVHGFTPARYALSLGVLAVLSLGVAVAAIIVLRDRTTAPIGTGMIVVQAPTPSPTTLATDAPSEAVDTTATPAAAVEPLAPTARAREKKVAASKSHKPTPGADPMQQMTTGVASAFAKQKAGVTDCLNRHPFQLEGSPQLTVRVSIDRRGKVTQAELLPEAISSKSVGNCVRNAVSAMTFPTPDKPMTFRVPLMWRRK